jgi:hypothetical protein
MLFSGNNHSKSSPVIGEFVCSSPASKKTITYPIRSQFNWIRGWWYKCASDFVTSCHNDFAWNIRGYRSGTVANKVPSLIRFVEQPGNCHCPSRTSRKCGLIWETSVVCSLCRVATFNLGLIACLISFGNVAKFRYLGRTVNNSKLHSWRNWYQIKFGEIFPAINFRILWLSVFGLKKM